MQITTINNGALTINKPSLNPFNIAKTLKSQTFKLSENATLDISNEARQMFQAIQKENPSQLRQNNFTEIRQSVPPAENFTLSHGTMLSHLSNERIEWSVDSDSVSFGRLTEQQRQRYGISEAADHFLFLTQQTHDIYAQLQHYSLDNIPMAEMGAQLMSVLGEFGSRYDVQNMTNLANKYSEMRQSLEEQFTGEELEIQISNLDRAFELTSDYYSGFRAMQTQLSMRREMVQMFYHNQAVADGRVGNFNMGKIEISEEKINDMLQLIDKISNGMRESLNHFTNIVKDFVMQNGLVSSEEQQLSLLDHLQNAEPNEKGFTFNFMNDIYAAMNADNRFATDTMFDRINQLF
ncbi:MAG: hypothetical protein FWG64_06700 [Firmicutes bacterium]|nr:hypothetical protein [Bacillota bacterium]